jgi:CubicO group peptidase (beta-lactamase class C family)
MGDALDEVLAEVERWGAANAAAAIVGPDGVRGSVGDPARPFAWASVTKPVTALAVLIAAERALVDLDEPAGPPGSTVRHLLAHASGLPFEDGPILAAPGRRRIYSNPGYDLLGELVAARTERPFEAALRDWVLQPLGMTGTRLVDRPSQGLEGSLADLATFAGECFRPTLLPEPAFRAATTVAFPGLPGVVPGVGRFDPCDWALGFEVHGSKSPHWMSDRNSPSTFGHFGGAGTFLWVDPVARIALAAVTDRPFGPWALDAWPALSDAVPIAST